MNPSLRFGAIGFVATAHMPSTDAKAMANAKRLFPDATYYHIDNSVSSSRGDASGKKFNNGYLVATEEADKRFLDRVLLPSREYGGEDKFVIREYVKIEPSFTIKA